MDTPFPPHGWLMKGKPAPLLPLLHTLVEERAGERRLPTHPPPFMSQPWAQASKPAPEATFRPVPIRKSAALQVWKPAPQAGRIPLKTSGRHKHLQRNLFRLQLGKSLD